LLGRGRAAPPLRRHPQPGVAGRRGGPGGSPGLPRHHLPALGAAPLGDLRRRRARHRLRGPRPQPADLDPLVRRPRPREADRRLARGRHRHRRRRRDGVRDRHVARARRQPDRRWSGVPRAHLHAVERDDVLIIGAVTMLAIFSVVTGVKKGIKWLSNINMSMAVALMLFVLVTGPTLFLLREFIQASGAYVQNLISLSFRTSALFDAEGVEWQGWWTAFYWGWWISWAPFVGVFIARISKGRTIRQFVAAVLLVPTTLAFLWFTVFGGTALNEERRNPGQFVARGDDGQPLLDADGNNISVNVDNSLFELLDGLPGGKVLVGLAIILVVLFFVTSSDSGSLVVDMLASGGDPEPPTWSRVFWSVLEGAVAAVLLTVGDETGLTALRYAAIIIALPFSVVMILMCWACLKQFRAERELALRIQRRQQREELTEHVTQNLIEDG